MAAPRKENVKDIIMDATEHLLETHSLGDLSLASIASEAGISKGTLYYHYKTKEDILLDITDRYLEVQWNNWITWVEDKEKDTSLHRLIKYAIEGNLKVTGPRLHLLYNACVGNEYVRESLIKRYEKFQRDFAHRIAERAGDENAEYLAWTALLISDGLIVQKALDNPDIDVDEYIKQTDEFIKKLSI